MEYNFTLSLAYSQQVVIVHFPNAFFFLMCHAAEQFRGLVVERMSGVECNVTE